MNQDDDGSNESAKYRVTVEATGIEGIASALDMELVESEPNKETDEFPTELLEPTVVVEAEIEDVGGRRYHVVWNTSRVQSRVHVPGTWSGPRIGSIRPPDGSDSISSPFVKEVAYVCRKRPPGCAPRDVKHIGNRHDGAAKIVRPAVASADRFSALTEAQAESAMADLDGNPDEGQRSPTQLPRRNRPIMQARELLEGDGVEFNIQGAIEDPGMAIENAVETSSADPLVIGGRPRSPTDTALFGCTPRVVLRNASCPEVSID